MVPIVFRMVTFLSQMIFHTSTYIPQNSPKLGIYLTPDEKFHNLLFSSISTTRWRYNHGKCILAYNSLCRTFKNIISTHSLNCAESRHIGYAQFRLAFSSANSQNYFFKLVPGDFTKLHKTLHTTSVDPPDKKILK